jgi:small-conductance mechanosensitive channel
MKWNVRFLTRTALILGIALAVQSLRLPSQITGVVINALLFTAAMLVHPLAALAIGLITPWIAVVTGIMGLVFMAPFIMAANASLALGYWAFRRQGDFVGMAMGSLAKYGVFVLTVNVLLSWIGRQLPPAALAVFGIMQLITAVGGGLLALVISQTLKPVISRANE